MNENERLDEALGDLAREDTADPRLERDVVSALRVQGLLASQGYSHLGLAAAALLIAFGLGWLARPPGSTPAAGAGSVEQPTFLLLLGGDLTAPPIGSAEVARRVAAHRAWATALRRDGRLVTSEKLAGSGERLEQPDAPPVSRAAFGGERLLGFFLVRADTLEQAVELSRSCPTLGFGGSVTVYPIDPT